MKKDFELDINIYKEQFIKQAIKDYQEAWWITFNKWILSIIWEQSEEIEEMFNEFMNYVAWLINEGI